MSQIRLGLVYRSIYGPLPRYLSDYFPRVRDAHNHSTRSGVADVCLYRFRRNAGKRYFLDIGMQAVGHILKYCILLSYLQSLNVNKTKEMIVDFRKQQSVHPPIYIDGTAVFKVESFKFLGVHITGKLKWTTYTDSVVKKAQQSLFNLRRQNKCVLSPKTLTNFYRCTIESIKVPGKLLNVDSLMW